VLHEQGLDLPLLFASHLQIFRETGKFLVD
jgi:hypothetical protein